MPFGFGKCKRPVMVRRSGYDPATGKRWPRDDEKENLRAELERLLRLQRDYLLTLLRRVEDEWDDGEYLTRGLRAEIRDVLEKEE